MARSDVALNASVVGRNPTGLGLYAVNLTRELGRIRPDLAVFGPVRARLIRISTLVRPERGLIGHAARLWWTQVILRARARGARLLLNAVPEGPLGGRVPQVTVVHDLLPLAFPGEYPRQQYYFRHLVPRVLCRSRVVVADSESTRAE